MRSPGKRAVMRRVSLGVLLMGLLLLWPATAGAAEIWTPADKHGFGTAHDLRSKVWFTLGDTRMDEVYWPDAGAPVERPRVVACRYAVVCP
jgi:Glucodextranase, domain N